MKAKLPWMTKYFGKGQNWYFIDAQGEPQGPFPPENMSNWFKAGYFWNKELMICHEGWESYVSLDSIMSASDSLVSPPRLPAVRCVSAPGCCLFASLASTCVICVICPSEACGSLSEGVLCFCAVSCRTLMLA